MIRKIKIYIQTKDRTLNLPKLSLKQASFLIKFGVRHGSKYIENNSDFNYLVKSNQNEIVSLIDMSINEINDLDPFVLVDIKSGYNRVWIEIL